MKSNGFRLIDFPVLVQPSANGPLLYLDAAFARVTVLWLVPMPDSACVYECCILSSVAQCRYYLDNTK